MYLPRKQRVLGDIRLSRILVERQQEQPHDADDDAENGEVRWELGYPGVAPKGQQSYVRSVWSPSETK